MKRLLKAKRFINQNSVLYVAHRGSSSVRPENTMAAFRKTLEDGVLGNEIDLRLSSDNQIVVIHDATVNRTTEFSGRVKDYTLNQLTNMDAGGWFSSSYADRADTKIPSFKQVLDEFQGTNIYLELDTKEIGVVDIAVPMIESYGMVSQCFFVGSEETSNYVKAHYPQFISYRGAPYNDVGNHLKNAKEHGQEIISWRNINDDVSKQIKKNRRLIRHSWTTTSSEQEIQRLIDRGVNIFLTDYPAVAKTVGDENGLVQSFEKKKYV